MAQVQEMDCWCSSMTRYVTSKQTTSALGSGIRSTEQRVDKGTSYKTHARATVVAHRSNRTAAPGRRWWHCLEFRLLAKITEAVAQTCGPKVRPAWESQRVRRVATAARAVTATTKSCSVRSRSVTQNGMEHISTDKNRT